MSVFKQAAFLLLLSFLGGACGYVQNSKAAVEKHAFEENSDRPRVENEAEPKTLDYALLTQDGKKVNLYHDLLKDRIVIMNFIFTDCSSVCNAQGNLFSRLQSRLGTRLGTEVNLVSLSKDPKNDTPRMLKSWGKSHGRKEGWTLLTGEISEITRAFIAFTGDPPIVIEHAPVMLVGNADKKEWIRVSGLEPIDGILELIEKIK